MAKTLPPPPPIAAGMELHGPRFSDFSIHSLMTARSLAEMGDPPGAGWPGPPAHALHPGLHDPWALPHHAYARHNPNMVVSYCWIWCTYMRQFIYFCMFILTFVS